MDGRSVVESAKLNPRLLCDANDPDKTPQNDL